MSKWTKGPRIVSHPDKSEKHECTSCGKKLTGRVAWLELDQRTNTYHDFGGVPSDKSQGWFPFGVSCARAILAKVEG